MAFGAQARVGEDLGDRVPRSGRLLALVGAPEGADVVGGVIVRDELQRVGDAADEIRFLNGGDGGGLYRLVELGLYSRQPALIHGGASMASTIESVLQEKRVFPPSPQFVKQANVSGMEGYRKLVAEAERDFEGFWARLARETLHWSKPFGKVLDESKAPFFRWFYDGELNASYNCLDRHLRTQGDKTAIIFEADDGKVTKITYRQLYHKVCQFANALKSLSVRQGERVVIYMRMSIEVVLAMQACARIGST